MTHRCSYLRCLFFVLSGLAICLPSVIFAQEKGMSRQDVLNALESGVVALRTIDRPDQAEQLLKTLREYANLVKDRPDREQKAPDGAHRKNLIPERYRDMTEEQIAERTIVVMKYAMEGLNEADKDIPAELMEDAIHARKLRLKRAKGDEAEKVMATAPNRANEIELLLYAARCLDEQGKGEKAMVVKEMGDWFHATRRRNRERDQEQSPDATGDRNRDRERNQERKNANHSVQHLKEQTGAHQKLISEFGQQLKRLAESNEKLRRQLNQLLEEPERQDR